MEEYRTVSGQAIAEIEEKKSRFIGHIAFADTEEKALAFLESVRAEHRTANHNVYAYLLREGSRMRYSDDGEPQKTSGLPTLDAIRHAGLTDCIIVTTRYFGGTLLGTGGLVRAYSHGASIALEAAGIVTMRECIMASLSCDYNQYGRLQALIPECGGTVDDTVFGERVTMYFHLTDADLGRMRPKLADATCGSVEVQEEGKKFFQVL